MLQKKEDILKLSLSFLFGTLLISLCIHKIFNYDIWWHLKTGEYILKNFTVPSKDIYTYTVAGHDWIDLHWIFQVFVFSIYRIFGANSLILCVASLISVCFYYINRLIKRIPVILLSI